MNNLIKINIVKLAWNALTLVLIPYTLMACAGPRQNTESIESADKQILKTMTQEIYRFNEANGEYIRELHAKVVHENDTSGEYSETFFYDSDNKLESKVLRNKDNKSAIFYYDDNGNIVSKGKWSSNIDEVPEYTEEGECMMTKYYPPCSEEDSFQQEDDKYDEKGHVTESTIYCGNKSFKTRTNYKYDSDGHMKMRTSYRIEGEKEYLISVEKYNEKGHVTESTIYCGNKSFKTRTNYKYDSDGHMKMRTSYRIEGEKEYPHRQIIYKYTYYP